MDIQTWSVRHEFITQLKSYKKKYIEIEQPITFDIILKLIDIIPTELLQRRCNRHTPRIELYVGFNNVIHCQQWLYKLNSDIVKESYFEGELFKPVHNRESVNMDVFLVDNNGMFHMPASILTTLRSHIMDCNNALTRVRRSDMHEYYSYKLEGMLPELNHVIQSFANLAMEVDYE